MLESYHNAVKHKLKSVEIIMSVLQIFCTALLVVSTSLDILWLVALALLLQFAIIAYVWKFVPKLRKLQVAEPCNAVHVEKHNGQWFAGIRTYDVHKPLVLQKKHTFYYHSIVNGVEVIW